MPTAVSCTIPEVDCCCCRQHLQIVARLLGGRVSRDIENIDEYKTAIFSLFLPEAFCVQVTMRGFSALGLSFLLRCSHTGALVPSARIFSASRGMVGLRRRVRNAVVSSEVEDSHAGIGEGNWQQPAGILVLVHASAACWCQMNAVYIACNDVMSPHSCVL